MQVLNVFDVATVPEGVAKEARDVCRAMWENRGVVTQLRRRGAVVDGVRYTYAVLVELEFPRKRDDAALISVLGLLGVSTIAETVHKAVYRHDGYAIAWHVVRENIEALRAECPRCHAREFWVATACGRRRCRACGFQEGRCRDDDE